jgi:peptidoglycan-associated lipoprotein
MVVHLQLMRYALVAVVCLMGAACAPSATQKNDLFGGPAPGAESRAKTAAAGAPGEDQRATTAREIPAIAPGSLEALQQDKTTATPAFSPLKDIYFDFDRYDLRADAREMLKTNADWLRANSATRIEIEGHCDERGTNEYNLALGARRAQSVKDYLVTLGISAERLSTISYGEELPVCREKTEQCWQQNRRARLVVIAARPAS